MRKRLLPLQPVDSVPGDPAPGNGKQMQAALDAGVEMLTSNRGDVKDPADSRIRDALDAGIDTITRTRGDISPIIKAAKAAKEALQ